VKILLVAAFGADESESYEYFNFYLPLKRITDDVEKYDFISGINKLGRQAMNEELLERIRTSRPDVTIFVPHTDQFIPGMIDEMNRHTKSVSYFFDDMWRVEYSRFWARHFNHVTTSDVNGIKRFRDAGLSNAVYSPFGCNTRFFEKKDLEKEYDVSFIGQYHPVRAWFLKRLNSSGLNVFVRGHGWNGGPVKYAEMVDIFNRSRINLNLSNSMSWDIRYLLGLKRNPRETLRVWRSTANVLFKKDQKVQEQVKGRHFEINACGGFQLSYYIEGLEIHYLIGREITVYNSIDDIAGKIQYYLKHNDEREEIAGNGYLRTQKDHDMEGRFISILREIGLTGR
jgi:spore maturation protein CgeB